MSPLFFIPVLVSSWTTLLLADTTIACYQDKMSVTLDSTQNVDKYTLKDSLSDPNLCETSQTSLLIDIPLDACGTRKFTNDTHIRFDNIVTGAVGERSSLIINRGPLKVIVVKCLYSRVGLTGTFGWISGEPVPDDAAIAAMTYGMTVFGGYINETLSNEFETYPIQLEDNEVLYVEIEFDIEFETETTLNLFVIIIDLLFTDDENIENINATTYEVVKNGCILDETAYEEIGQSYYRTSFYMNTSTIIVNETNPLFLHSLVKLCDESDPDFETCKTTCDNSDTSKRDLDTFFAEFDVYIGEFQPAPTEGSLGGVYHMSVPLTLLFIIALYCVL